MFLERNAVTCDWEESDLLKENISMLMELSLYTPPVTPGRAELSKESSNDIGMMVENLTNPAMDKLGEMSPEEFIHSKKDLVISDKLPLLDPFELENNFTEKNIDVIYTKPGNTSVNSFKVLPKVTDIQKTNIDLTIFSSVSECYNNQKVQKLRQLPTDINNITDLIKNYDILFDNTSCNKLDLNTQCEMESDQNKNSMIQLDDMANVEKFSPEIMLEATQSTNYASITSLVATNNSILNMPDCDFNIDTIDAILEDIFNDKNI